MKPEFLERVTLIFAAAAGGTGAAALASMAIGIVMAVLSAELDLAEGLCEALAYGAFLGAIIGTAAGITALALGEKRSQG